MKQRVLTHLCEALKYVRILLILWLGQEQLLNLQSNARILMVTKKRNQATKCQVHEQNPVPAAAASCTL